MNLRGLVNAIKSGLLPPWSAQLAVATDLKLVNPKKQKSRHKRRLAKVHRSRRQGLGPRRRQYLGRRPSVPFAYSTSSQGQARKVLSEKLERMEKRRAA